MQTYAQNVFVGGGVKRLNNARFIAPVKTAEQIAEEDRKWREYEAASKKRAEEERQRMLVHAEWEDNCRRIITTPPEGLVCPLDGDEIMVRVERIDASKPMAAYVLLRPSQPLQPELPVWGAASSKKHGLKGFFVRESREQIMNTHHWLAEEGGTVILRGMIRVVGKAASGKSLHVELVEGFRLR